MQKTFQPAQPEGVPSKEIYPEKEKVIEEVGKVIEEKKEGIEVKKEEAEEAIKDYLREIKETPAVQPPADQVISEAEAIKVLTKKRQAQYLVNLCFKKGIHYALHVAQKLNDPFILDELHDRLINELYTELVKRKKLKLL